MNRKAGIAGAAVLGLALSASAYTSPYTSMAVPGTHNGWATAGSMVLAADNVWVCTQTFAAADGEFKFVANDGWAISWGCVSDGSVIFIRVPAVASAPTTGGENLKYTGLSNGTYRITFNDTNFEFRVEWAGGSPLPLPAFTNVSLVGGFNGWTAGLNLMTNPPGNTNLWMCSVDLAAETAFQFLPEGNWSYQYGAPEIVSLPVPVVDASGCGKANITLSGFEPGTFQFALNTSNATFSVSQTSTQSFTLMTAQGNFVATNNPPPNMMQIAGTTLWESDHDITNSGTLTLRFSGNNGARRWGATNSTPAYALPAEGSAVSGQTNFAQVTGVTPGRYRISFNHQSGAFTLRQSYTNDSGVNLLTNPGFEETTGGDAGGDPVGWTNWQAWPKAWTNGFAPHSGRWCGAIHGKLLPDWDDYGSLSQNMLIISGRTYRASAWFKATPDWSAESMQIKIEWHDTTNGLVGIESIFNLPALTTNWVKYFVEGTAPTNATRALVLFLCAGADTTGTLHVDDAEFRAAAGRAQNFDTWGTLTNFAPFAPDWEISSGKTVLNTSPPPPPSDVFISEYVEGTGNNKAIEIYNGLTSNLDLSAQGYVLQQYNNGATTASVTMALSGTISPSNCLVVTRPSIPTNFLPTNAISGLTNIWTNKYLTFNGDDVIVLRKGGAAGTVKDRIGQVSSNASSSIWRWNTLNHTLTRQHTVFTGTVGDVSAAFPLSEWELHDSDTLNDLGRHYIIDPNAPYTPSGYSLVMNTNATLMSGELAGGVGDISFWWRTESLSPAVTMVIETAVSAEGPWTNAATLADLAAGSFTYYAAAINRPDALYLRLRQTDAGTNRFQVDDIYISEYSPTPRLQDFNAWTDPSFAVPGTYSRSGWSILSATIAPNDGVSSSRAARLTPPSSGILCPAFEGGVGEYRFWAEAVDPKQPARLLLRTTVDGGSNWVTRDTLNVSTAQTFSTWLYVTNVGAQASLIFDPLYNSGEVFVDNVEVRLPVLYRSQNFDGWPTRTGYVSENFQGWIVNNSIVDSSNAYAGQVARLYNAIGNYVQSPEIPDGIGSISFRIAKWSASDAAYTLQVQLSPNGTSWTTFTNVSASSTSYQQFVGYLLDTSNRFVRLYHSEAAVRVLIDDIVIGLPLPRPQVLVTPSLDPAAPYYEDPMRILANVVSRYGADILTVTGAYAIASTTNYVQMTATNLGSYTAVSEIPAQPAGTMVRYFVTVRYAGIGANSNFSGYATNSFTTAFYTNYVSSVPLGHVWINEIFYAPYGTEPWNEEYTVQVGCNHEFVELCGRAGVSISNWTVQLLFGADADIAKNGGQPVYATYKLTPGHTFTNQTNSFSFYVLGDGELSTNYPINKYLTTYVPTNVAPFAVGDKDHIYDGIGVIRLLNEYSNVVYALSYGGYAPGATYIRQSQPSYNASNSLGLKGSNYTYTGFVWSNSTITAGGVNAGQILAEPPPDSNVYAWAWHTQSQHITPINTNIVPPFYMLDPETPAHYDIIDVYYGFTNADYSNPDGTLYHRRSGGGWSTLDMNIRDSSIDSGGYAYVYGNIPDHTYRRLQTVEYVVEVIPNETGVERVYLGSDAGGANVSTIYTNLAGAQAHPFTYPVPIGDQITITNFVLGTTSAVFGTEGNDMQDPLTNFYIKVATNMRTPTHLWFSTNFTAVRDIYSNYTFTVPKATSRWSNVFYRVDPRWP